MSPLIEKVGTLLRNDMVERNRAQADSDIDMRMLVHQSKAGAVIGFKGETIKGLREKTGCKINVYQDPAPHSSDRLIKVAGQPDKIATCFGEILLILNDIPPKGKELAKSVLTYSVRIRARVRPRERRQQF